MRSAQTAQSQETQREDASAAEAADATAPVTSEKYDQEDHSKNTTLAFHPHILKCGLSHFFRETAYYNEELSVKTKNYRKIATKKGYTSPLLSVFQN